MFKEGWFIGKCTAQILASVFRLGSNPDRTAQNAVRGRAADRAGLSRYGSCIIIIEKALVDTASRPSWRSNEMSMMGACTKMVNRACCQMRFPNRDARPRRRLISVARSMEVTRLATGCCSRSFISKAIRAVQDVYRVGHYCGSRANGIWSVLFCADAGERDFSASISTLPPPSARGYESTTRLTPS